MKWLMPLALAIFTTGCASRAELLSAQAAATEAEDRAAGFETRLSDSHAALESAQVTATALTERNSLLQADLDQARQDYQQASNEVGQLSDQVGKYLCDSQISDMKYDSVTDASTILSAWYARQPGVQSVHTPYRDKIWNNALSQLHGITYTSSEDHQQYVEHFMVYFDEFGFTPSVFWIGGQCWLDPP